MDCSHHRANQPLYVTSEVRAPGRTVVKMDAILLAAAHQRFGVELLGIVDMNRSRQPMDRPVECLKLAVSQPRGLRENRMGKGERKRYRRRRPQRTMKARNHPCSYIDGEREARTAYRTPPLLVAPNYVHRSRIDRESIHR